MLFIIYLFFIFIPLCVCVCVSFDVCVYVFRSELISRMETTRECMGPMPTSGLVGCCLDNTHPTNHPPKRVVMETGRDIYIGSRTRAPELFQSIGHWARRATRRRIKSGPAAVGPISCGTNREIALLLVSLFFFLFPPFCVRPPVSIIVSRRPIYNNLRNRNNNNNPGTNQVGKF
jgi:hypothetical protein